MGGNQLGMTMGASGPGSNLNMGKSHQGEQYRRGVMNGMYQHHMQGSGGIIQGPGGIIQGPGGMMQGPGHVSHGSYRSANVGNVLPGGGRGGGGGGGGHMSGSRDMMGYTGGGTGSGGGYYPYSGDRDRGRDRDRERVYGGSGGGGEKEYRFPPRSDHRSSGKERGERGGGHISGGFMASAQGQGLGLGPGQGLGPHTHPHSRSQTSPGPHPHYNPIVGVGGQIHTGAAASAAYSTGTRVHKENNQQKLINRS